MSILGAEPPAPVHSLEELFALAETMEREAAERYEQLAASTHAIGLTTVAAALEKLAAAERRHQEKVVAQSRARTGAAPDTARMRWQPPGAFEGEEAGGAASAPLASIYRAISMAVRYEESAFAFWTYVAAQSEDDEIRAAAEDMAREELGHAAILRRERRRAFHAERDVTVPAQRVPSAVEALRAEQALVRLLAAAAEAASVAGRPSLPREIADMTAEVAAAAGLLAQPGQIRSEPATPSAADAMRLSDRCVEAFLQAADAANSEASMLQFQSLAERALRRAAALHRWLCSHPNRT